MLLLLTRDDQVYSIENMLWSARRESKADTEAKAARELEKASTLPTPGYKLNKTEEELIDVKSKQFPPYDGVIPQKNTNYISYNLQLIGLNKIYTYSTRLESTSAVLVTGHDIFYARVTAESIFDRLHDNFKSEYIAIAVGGLVTLLYVAGIYVKNKDAREAFLLK